MRGDTAAALQRADYEDGLALVAGALPPGVCALFADGALVVALSPC